MFFILTGSFTYSQVLIIRVFQNNFFISYPCNSIASLLEHIVEFVFAAICCNNGCILQTIQKKLIMILACWIFFFVYLYGFVMPLYSVTVTLIYLNFWLTDRNAYNLSRLLFIVHNWALILQNKLTPTIYCYKKIQFIFGIMAKKMNTTGTLTVMQQTYKTQLVK